ncbi:MAG TPA: ABC transporter permease, partial [Terriglobales bacterium]|nr:ABC transporter permease [Terriglobales bacterium]
MSTWLQDVRFAVRMLIKSPAFSATVILTLALGIGANTALFSVVNSVLLNPLSYPRSNQLVALYEKKPSLEQGPISYLNFLDWQRATRSFSSMAIYRHEDYNLTGSGQPERVNGLMVSSAFFTTLGIHPAVGRDFIADDDHVGAAPVVLLSDSFWHRHFGGSPSVVGSSVDLGGTNYTIIGILPAEFTFYEVDRDVFTPIGQLNDPSFLDRRIDLSTLAIARLKDGVTLAQARAEMDSIAQHLALAYPDADKNVGVDVVPLKQDLVGKVRPVLLVLLGAVIFLLLIACANVANLLLVRAMRRSGEFAVRKALGAGSRRLILQLLTESLLLAASGGVAGFLIALLGTRTAIQFLPGALPRGNEVSIDLSVLLFTLAVSLLCGLAFGLAPAMKLSRVDLQQVLRQSTRGGGGSHRRMQAFFVAAEVALSVVLLVGAGLMLRSLSALLRVNPGYNPEHAITFSLSLSPHPKATQAETLERLRHLDAEMRAIPGVQVGSITLGSRPLIHDSELPFWIDGQPKPATMNEMPQAMFYLVEGGFQQAMGITLEGGRFVAPQDDEKAPIAIDVDDVFAREYFPRQNPIGRHIHIAGFDVEAEIVGVVGHVRQWGPGTDAKGSIEAQFYYPFMQLPPKLIPLVADGVAVVLRTRGDPAATIAAVRRAVLKLDPGAVVYAVESMNGVLSKSLAARRLSLLLLGAFAVLALTLSCTGMYGVLSYLADDRTREIGVRMALGARRGDVLRMILTQGVRMALAGVALGLMLSLGLTYLMASQLFGVTPHDPLTFAAAGLLLVAVA